MEKETANFFKPVDGKSKVRLLPVMYGDNPGKVYKSHYIGGKYILCPGDGCPVCAKGWELHNEFKDLDPAQAKASRAKWLPQTKVALTVLADGEVKIWNVTQSQFKEIAGLDEEGDLFNVDKGRDLIISKTGKKLATRYSFTYAASPSKVDNYDELADAAPDLDDFIETQKVSNTDLLKIVIENA